MCMLVTGKNPSGAKSLFQIHCWTNAPGVARWPYYNTDHTEQHHTEQPPPPVPTEDHGLDTKDRQDKSEDKGQDTGK